ncbi:otoferlin isoform X8 [Hydra vulgaris]|uniref:Otoferlin isoform X8 n=1 Tax=Hydra vulgaris TaxID=6087 RepID=A0ABM4D654_HYDVU
MSINVKDIVIKHVPSRFKVLLWIYFRGGEQKVTNTVSSLKGIAQFQPQLWTFSKTIENESLTFELYQEKGGLYKLLGKCHIAFGKFQKSIVLKFYGNKFLNEKKKEIKIELDFELEYELPYDIMSIQHAGSHAVLFAGNLDENDESSDDLKIALPIPEIDIVEDWKVHIRIHQGKELFGKDCRPYVRLRILDEKSSTNVSDSANPVWEEEFMFSFKVIRAKLLDSVLHIKAITSKNFKKEKIGSAKFDLWTVYNETNHCIQKKWAVLQEVNSEEIKGYILVSISIYQTEEPVQLALNDEIDLESNLLLPIGYIAPRDVYSYSITVYKAESVAAAKHSIITAKEKVNISHPFIKEQLKKLFGDLRVQEATIAQKIEVLKIIKMQLGTIVNDPQQSFPDIFIWMIADKKRIAYTRVKAESVLNSQDLFFCAPYSGKLQSLFLQFYKFDKQERNQRFIQGKIEIRIWLGCSTNKPVNYLPSDDSFELPIDRSTPYPRHLEYKSDQKYILHAHIFQGRTVFGSDENGLSDPFARVMFGNNMEETWAVPKTRMPLWDQSFVFDKVTLYGTNSNMSLPVVLITLFDKDSNGEEFIGQAIASPRLITNDYVPAKLQLIPLYLGKQSVGDILASFELFPVDYDNLPELPSPVSRNQAYTKEPVMCVPVPRAIRPVLVSYKVELLFWGLRDLEKNSGIFGKRVQRPQVFADFSYNAMLPNGKSVNKLESTICRNAIRNPNFENPILIFDMDLPENTAWMPDCTFMVVDHSQFTNNKKIQFFATHTTHTIDRFIFNAEEFKTTYFEGSAPGSKISLSYMPKKKVTKETVINIEPVDNEEVVDWWTRFYASEKSQITDEENDLINITIYNHELEKEFNDFHDLFTTFPLVRGKQDAFKNEWDPRRIKGKFKGAIRLWRNEDLIKYKRQLKANEGTFSYLPPKAPVKVCVRIYCIMALGLTAKDIISGKSDPYIIVQFGKSKSGNPSKHVANNLNPEFGEVHEVEGTIPFDTTLTVQVYDFDRGAIRNELIGQTQIDIENRYFTKYRAKCGLPQEYKKQGVAKWRDIQSPTEIISELALRCKIDVDYKDSDSDQEEIAFAALKKFQRTDFKFVPEHVETRNLTHPNHPEVSQGKLLMWADIFPAGNLPPPVDIAKPKPVKYEIRIIIWNCSNVPCIDKSILLGNMPTSDIYVKGWLSGMPGKSQKTDIHYRSTDGSGMFNWRFIFQFDYYQAKRMFIFKKKLSPLSIDETEFYFPAELILECREADLIGSRKFGRLNIDLLKLPPYYIKSSGWTLEDWEERLKNKKEKKMSLFKYRNFKGWLPFMVPDEIDPKKNVEQGRVEIEIELVTEDEAKDRPVGIRREEPQALPKPDRPEESLGLFMNPFKMARLLWKSYKWFIFKVLLLLLLLLLIALFIYAFPGYLAKKTIGI